MFSRNAKKHIKHFGFSAEIQKNTWKFLDFPAEIQKKHTWKSIISEKIQDFQKIQNFHNYWASQILLEILDFHVFFGFSAEFQKIHGNLGILSRNPKKTHGNFWIFSRNPKKHMEIFGFSAEIQKNTLKSKISKSFWCAQ